MAQRRPSFKEFYRANLHLEGEWAAVEMARVYEEWVDGGDLPPGFRTGAVDGLDVAAVRVADREAEARVRDAIVVELARGLKPRDIVELGFEKGKVYAYYRCWVAGHYRPGMPDAPCPAVDVAADF